MDTLAHYKNAKHAATATSVLFGVKAACELYAGDYVNASVDAGLGASLFAFGRIFRMAQREVTLFRAMLAGPVTVRTFHPRHAGGPDG